MEGLGGAALDFGIGAIIEELRRGRAKRETSPYMQFLDSVDKPSDAAPVRFQFNTSELSPEVRNYLRTVTTTGTGAGGQERVTGNVDPQGLGELRVQGALNRFETQQELEKELKGQLSEAETGYDKMLSNMGQGLRGIDDQTNAGLAEMEGQYNAADRAIGQGVKTADENLRANIDNINQQLAVFRATADSLTGQIYTLKGEALEQAADQSAQILESMTTGVTGRMQAQFAEIDSDPNLTAGQKNALKQRTSFVSGVELRQTASKVMSDEAMRRDQIIAEHDRMITDTTNTIAQASAAMEGQAIAAAGSAFEQHTAARAQLAESTRLLNQGFADLSSDYRASMTQTRATLQTAMEGMRLSGRLDLYNMASAIPRAYLDLSQEFAEIMGFNMGINQADFDRGMSMLNAGLAREGFVANTSMPSGMMGEQAGYNYFNTANAPQPEQPGAFETIAGGFVEGAGTGFGALLGGSLIET